MSVVLRGVRNAFRNRVRTVSIVFILGLSLALGLIMLVAHRAINNRINSVKSNDGNSVIISPAGFSGFSGGGNPLTTAQLAKVAKLNHVTAVSETLTDRLTSSDTNLVSAINAGRLGVRFGGGQGGTILGGGGSFTPPVQIEGTNTPTSAVSSGPGGNAKVTIKSGSIFNGSAGDNEALIGQALATKNNLKVGSTFSAYGGTLTVRGIFSTGTKFGDNLVIVPLATEQNLSSQPGDVTAAVARVDSVSNLSRATNEIKGSLGGSADVTNTSELAEQAIGPLQNIATISVYSLVGALVAGAVITFLTMIMVVKERRREIGVLKAIGGSNPKVVSQFMAEAVTLTLMGAVIGIVIGIWASRPVTRLLVNSTNGAGPRIGGGGGFVRRIGLGGFRNGLSAIHAVVGWSLVGWGLLAVIMIAVVASLLASYSVARIRPAEVFRAE